MDNIAQIFEPEEYRIVTSDNRRFIIRTADPETARRNFPVAGETLRVLSIEPVMVRENLLTVHQLAEALAVGCANPPNSQTLRRWAKQRLIPYRRIGRKFVRFVEVDVRRAMEDMEKRS
jgi:hypothetical protein